MPRKGRELKDASQRRQGQLSPGSSAPIPRGTSCMTSPEARRRARRGPGPRLDTATPHSCGGHVNAISIGSSASTRKASRRRRCHRPRRPERLDHRRTRRRSRPPNGRSRAIERLGEGHVRAAGDRADPPPLELPGRAHPGAGADEQRLVEHRVGTSEVDPAGTLRSDRLAAPDRVTLTGVKGVDHLDPWLEHPVERPAERLGNQCCRRRLVALADAVAALAEERHRVGVDTDETKRVGAHGM